MSVDLFWYRLFVITKFMGSDFQESGGRRGRGVQLVKMVWDWKRGTKNSMLLNKLDAKRIT